MHSKYIFSLAFIFLVIWTSPLWFASGRVGIADWDYLMQRNEAIRKTVSEFNQWPGHNPWIRGGLPLLGNPVISLLSIKGLLCLFLGTFWGLRLGSLVFLFIGFFGAWKLSGIWWKERFFRIVFCLFIVANPASAYHTTVGHLVFQTFWFMPLLLYFFLRFEEDGWSGLKAGFVFGLAYTDSPAYIVQYGLVTYFCLFFWLFARKPRQDFPVFFRWFFLFIPTFGAICFFRTATMLPVAFDFPRALGFKFHLDWDALFNAYLVPHTHIGAIVPYVSGPVHCGTTWESCSYIGIIALVCFLFSFTRGFRWWHATIILLIWAGSGNDSYFHIMYWVQKLPSFSSHLCITRIRVFAIMFFGIPAVWGLHFIWSLYEKFNIPILKYTTWCLGCFMAGEVLSVSHLIMRSSHVDFDFQTEYNPGRKFRQISSLPPDGSPSSINLTYFATTMNLGWLRGFGDPYIYEKSGRIGQDEAGYIAEFHQHGTPVEPLYWSPNRILIEGLDPQVPLVVNMNPGRPWYSNDVQLFPDYRLVEPGKSFEVNPDGKGVVELTYRYPGQKLGIAGSVCLAIVSVGVVCYYRKPRASGPQKA